MHEPSHEPSPDWLYFTSSSISKGWTGKNVQSQRADKQQDRQHRRKTVNERTKLHGIFSCEMRRRHALSRDLCSEREREMRGGRGGEGGAQGEGEEERRRGEGDSTQYGGGELDIAGGGAAVR